MFRYAEYAVLKRLRVIFTLRAPPGLNQKAVEALRGKCLAKAVERVSLEGDFTHKML